MRSLVIAGLAACSAMLSPAFLSSADSAVPGRTVAGNGDVPDLALNPPPGPGAQGHWTGQWQGQSRWSGYPRFRRGYVFPRYWVGPRFRVNDWPAYGLASPGPGRSWIRHYDDAYMIDDGGRVFDEAYDIDWDRYAAGPVPDYAGGDRYEGDYPPPYPEPERGYRENHRGPGPALAPYQAGGTTIYAPPGSTTVIVQSGGAVMTTTTTVEEIPYRTPVRRGWRPTHPCGCR